jgi:DNA-binding transcriptional LysR family regulator
MDRLEAMMILVSAVDTGSLSAASRQLRIPLATVSRRVAELEAHLNVRLLHRGRRSLVLTEAGRNYVASCRRLMDEIAEVERTASGEYSAPQGELTISAPVGMGRIHLLPIVDDFLSAFPDIRVRLQLTDRHVYFADDHVDLALRVGDLADSSSVVAARVGAVRLNLCASPAYLEKRGLPRSPADLATHDCLVHETHAASHHWRFFTEGVMQTVEVPYRLSVSMGDATVAAAVAGAGIARGLSYLTDDLVRSGALVRVLEAYEAPPLVVNLVYPSQRQLTLKLRAFLDFAIPRLRDRLGGAGRSGS